MDTQHTKREQTTQKNNLFEDLPDLVPLDKAAVALGVGRNKKYELLDKVAWLKEGKSYMVVKASLIDYVLARIQLGKQTRRKKC